jgi:2-hydroxychromene-2-carboxylate isomerase
LNRIRKLATLAQGAIERQVFGAPTYIYRDEMFWGQDRLDFLGREMAK